MVDTPVKDFVRAQTDVIIDGYSATGANGDVYFGTRKILSDRVALKFYYYNPIAPIHQEPVLLKEIKHKNIIEIYDARVIDNKYAYFLTPEISGGDLQSYLDSNALSIQSAISITRGILQGLAELHKHPNNLLHRDLKPDNILINKHNLEPCIADFGSIIRLPDSSAHASVSKNNFFYQPCEAVKDKIYTKQSDLYQVGIILFRMLGGHFPMFPQAWLNKVEQKEYDSIQGGYEKWTFIERVIEKKIVTGKLLSYDSLPFYVDDKLKKIVKKATHIDYKKRYATCVEFQKALFDYGKDAIDWVNNSGIVHAKRKDGTEFKISPDGTSFKLETLKGTSPWRRNNQHDGKLKSIIALINK
ncbi:protein kinase domain-containing protein [Hymenobacter perfusus]|nr:protein kinase [Hymenobacter perfusus]